MTSKEENLVTNIENSFPAIKSINKQIETTFAVDRKLVVHQGLSMNCIETILDSFSSNIERIDDFNIFETIFMKFPIQQIQTINPETKTITEIDQNVV